MVRKATGKPLRMKDPGKGLQGTKAYNKAEVPRDSHSHSWPYVAHPDVPSSILSFLSGKKR
jgi:hypothetical protein